MFERANQINKDISEPMVHVYHVVRLYVAYTLHN